MNTEERAHRYRVSVSGLDGLELVAAQPLEIPAASTVTVPVSVRLDPAGHPAGSHPVVFRVESLERPEITAHAPSRFFVR